MNIYQKSAEQELQRKMTEGRKSTFEEIFKQPIDTKWADKLKEGLKNERK